MMARTSARIAALKKTGPAKAASESALTKQSKVTKTSRSARRAKPVKAIPAKTHTNKKRLRPTDDENEDTALPKAKKVKADSKVGEAALTTKKRSRTEDEAETATTLPAVKKARTDLNEPPKEVLKVFVCGSDDSGELGFGKQKGYKAIVAKTPRLNQHLSGVVQITLGGMHGIALINDNKILTWGVNDQFALGRDTTATNVVMKDIDDNNNGMDADDDVTLNVLEATPTAIESSAFPPNTKFVQVCAGDSTSFALTSTGLVYGWGIFRDSKGPFGFNVIGMNEVSDQPQKTPKLIEGLENIAQIACGGDHALALDKDGSVFAWGTGEHAQLGRPLHPAYMHRALTPLRVRFPKAIVSISAGANHSFGIDKNDRLYAWGLNNFGQCGIPRNAGKANAKIMTPRLVKAFQTTKVKMVAGGNFHSIAVTQTGDCMTWGKMDDYQSGIKMKDLPLDDKEIISKTETGRPCILRQPIKVANITDASYVAAGSDHCLAITQDGRAFSWGFNVSHQCGQKRSKNGLKKDEDEEDDEDDLDEVKEATLMKSNVIDEENLVWAGAGGQFSAFAAHWVGASVETEG